MKRTTRYVAGSGHLRRITTALPLIVAALISLTAVSCGTQSSQSLREGQAIEAAIERWRLADMSLRLAPFGGDDDRSTYGPDSWPHEGSPYPVYEMRTEDHLF